MAFAARNRVGVACALHGTHGTHRTHRDQVAMCAFVSSPERLTTHVNGCHLHPLGRCIDPSGAPTWAGILQDGGARRGHYRRHAIGECNALPHLLRLLRSIP